MKSLRQDDYIRGKLVDAGWQFGRAYGGHLASCMVMSCIANRQRLGWGSWLEVIKNIPKYAAILELPTETPLQIWDPEFTRLLREVDAIYDGSQDYAKGAVYWCDSTHVTNPWFKDKILGDPAQHPKVADMNSLMFFR